MGNNKSLSTKPDPATGLSARDKHLIKKSWAEVAHPDDVKENGVDLFVQLFLRLPHTKEHFKHYEEKDLLNPGVIPAFRAHALSTMAYVTTYVQSLNDTETLVALVEKLVDSHIGRGITLKDFQDIATIVFIPYLRSIMGKKRVTPEIEDAWRKFLGAQNAIFESKVKAIEQA